VLHWQKLCKTCNSECTYSNGNALLSCLLLLSSLFFISTDSLDVVLISHMPAKSQKWHTTEWNVSANVTVNCRLISLILQSSLYFTGQCTCHSSQPHSNCHYSLQLVKVCSWSNKSFQSVTSGQQTTSDCEVYCCYSKNWTLLHFHSPTNQQPIPKIYRIQNQH